MSRSKITPARFATLLFARLVGLAAALVAEGWPDISEWWRDTLIAFLRAGTKQLVVRAGRRSGKSSTACVFAVAFALVYSTLGLVPPGDTGWVVFVSVSREEASSRLRTITRILQILHVPFVPDGETLRIKGTNIGFRVLAATVAATSGWTSILVVADEVAKWRERESGANPASEVLAALRPTMATQPFARIILLSSPLGREDAHAKAFDAGTTDAQMTAFAPTWIANPTITEEQTRRDEPDPRYWAREYAAIPQAGVLSAFDADASLRAFEPRPKGVAGQRVRIIDASSGKKDRWTRGDCYWVQPPGAPAYLQFDAIDGIDAGFWKQESGGAIVARIAADAKVRGVRVVHGDQRESMMLRGEFGKHGLGFVEHVWTASSKPPAVERVRRWLADGALSLPAHDQLRNELLGFEERVTASGAFTFGARGSGHDDYVSLLITAAMADAKGMIPRGGRARAPAPTLNRIDVTFGIGPYSDLAF